MPTDATLSVGKSEDCVFCERIHASAKWRLAYRSPVEDLWSKVRKDRLCYNCLSPRRRVKDDVCEIGCSHCSDRHNILLCNRQKGNKASSPKTSGIAHQVSKSLSKANETEHGVHVKSNIAQISSVFQTAKIKVYG